MKDITQYIRHVFIINITSQKFITRVCITLLLCSSHFALNSHISNYSGNLEREKSFEATVEFHWTKYTEC